MINLNLELTDVCNIKCKMCGQFWSNKVHTNPASFMKWDVWKAMVDGLAEVEDEVSLCPHWLGEPTLHPRFNEFIRYAFEHNEGNRLFRHFKLHTNGSLLHKPGTIDTILDCANMEGMAEDTFRFVHFSIDAMTPAVYYDIKKFDYGGRVYSNVVRLIEERERRGLKWPYVTNAFIVMPENRHEARWFLDYWDNRFGRLGIDYEVSYDWPSKVKDTLYFRRLHQKDQAAADRLHLDVIRELGLVASDEQAHFNPQSF